MRTFYTNDFVGHWPVGTGAVVLAKDKSEARRKLRALLKKHGLIQTVTVGAEREVRKHEWTIQEVTEGPAVMINDGEY